MVKGVSQNQNKINSQETLEVFINQEVNQNSAKYYVQVFHRLENLLADGRSSFGLAHGVKV